MKMPKENIDTSMFAPWGMNCLVCYKHCCHKKPCAGCLNSDKGKPEHCRKCKIKDCIKVKKLPYCFECSDYPCKRIKNLEKSYNKRYQESLMENRNSDKTLFIAFNNCYILSSKSPQTLKNTKFIASEFALMLSLVLYPFLSCYILS